MADVTIESSLVGSGTSVGWTNAIVWTAQDTGYAFFINSANNLQYRKTTDGGATWAAAVTIDAGGGIAQFYVWYGKWNTSNALIHIWQNDTGDQIRYRSLTPSTDTLAGPVSIVTGAATGLPPGGWVVAQITACRALGGNLYVAGKVDNGGASGVFDIRRSVDEGANWTTRAAAQETSADEMMLLPGNAADQQDIYVIYGDASADELSVKYYDDSANTVGSETTISGAGGYVEAGNTHLNWDAMYYNGTIYVTWFTQHNNGSANLKFSSFTANTNTPTVNAKTNVLSASAGSVSPRIMINGSNGDIYVFYLRGTVSSSMQVYYKKSTDGGTTWGTETQYAEAAASNYIICDSGRIAHGTDGGRIGVTWRQDTNDDLFWNKVNSVAVAAAGGGGSTRLFLTLLGAS